MKKTILLLITSFFLLSSQNVFAQKKSTSKFELRAGIGLLPTYFKDRAETNLLPLSLGFKYKLNKKMSLETFIAHSRSTGGAEPSGDQVPPQWQNNLTVVGLRAAVHPNTYLEKWDFYGGMMVNYHITEINVLRGNPDLLWDHMGFKPNSGKLVFSGFVGTNFKLGNKLGLFGEIGYGSSLLKTGVTFAL